MPSIATGSRLRRSVARWIAFLLLAGLAQASSTAWAQQKVRVGLYQNLPKIGDDGGRPQGIFVDVIEAIAREEGWSLEYVPGTFRQGLDRLAAGEIDLMPDVARTTAREALYAFHAEPVLTSWSQVYARPDAGIRSMLDLQGRRVAVLEGSVQQAFIARMAEGFRVQVTLRPEPDFPAAFRAVSEGQADAVVTNRFYGVRNAKAAGLEDTAIIFDPSDLYFAGALAGSQALLQAVDRRLLAMKKDSASPYHRSIVQWTQADRPHALPPWVRWAALGALLVLAAAAAWVATLRRAAGKLRRSEEQQRLLADELGRIFEYSLDAICVGDENLRFVRASGACYKLWGYTPDELAGRPYLDLIPPEDHQGALAIIATLRKGERVRNLEARSLRKDGTIVHVVWSAVWSPRERRWYGIARDDSERRRLLGQLRDARDAALAGDRAKSAFLATMSHELRTPLNSIIGFTGIVLQGLAGPLNDEQRKQLGMVRDSARHLLALINDVLDISKIEAGELRVVMAPFPLARSIERVAAMVGPLAQKKQLRLTIHSGGDLGTMRGDSRRLEQVLLNLLGNAVKFTEAGGITLEVARIPDFRASEEAAAGPAVALTVTDTGIGIAPASLALIFEPFQQLDSTLSRAHEGTGLGLAICKRLTALMGGTIEARSVPGQGSAFTVTLPLNEPDAPSGQAPVQVS